MFNSFRSLSVKLGDDNFGQVVRSCEQLVQSLIAHDTPPSPDIDSVILEVTSGWLGREFRSMGSSVQAAVEKFKSENIESIDKLPSAYDTCSYFPRPMVALFENWLLSREDNSGEPMCKRQRTQATDIYPFIQLLLEFSNNALISGVAHVVYTQLLKDPT